MHVVLLLAVLAQSGPTIRPNGWDSLSEHHFPIHGTISAYVDAGVPDPSFSFAPDGGSGLFAVVGLCDAEADAGMLQGNFGCMKNDGSNASGAAFNFSVVGSPTVTTNGYCPHGTNCGQLPALLFSQGNRYDSAARAVPTGDFHACCIVTAHKTSNMDILGKYGSSAGNRSFLLDSNASDLSLFLYDGSGNQTSLVGGVASYIYKARNLACFDYRRTGGAADNLLRIWLNGALINSVTNAALMGSSATEQYRIGSRNGGSSLDLAGFIEGCAVSEYRPSATEYATLWSRVSATPVGTSDGGTLNYTRTQTAGSTSACPANDAGTLWAMLPANTPCIYDGALLSETGTTNLLQLGNSLDLSPWANINAPTVTADNAVGLDGLTKGETIVDDDAAAFEGRSQSSSTTTQSKYTASCGISGSFSKARITLTGTGNSAGDTDCDFTDITTDWARKICTTTSAYGAGITAIITKVQVGTAAADTGTIKVDKCSTTPETRASSHVSTSYAATATRGPTTAWAAAANLNRLGTIEAHVKPKWVGNTPPSDAYAVDTRTNVGSGLALAGGRTLAILTTGVVRCGVWDGTTHLNVDSSALSFGPEHWYDLSCEIPSDGGVITVRVDGGSVATGVATVVPVHDGPAFYIGSAADGGGQFNGLVRASYTPVGGLFPTPIAIIGDSLMAGTIVTPGVNDPGTYLQAAKGNAYNIYNYGVSGSTASGCNTRWTAQTKGRGFRHLVYDCMINDVRNGTAAATAWATASATLDDVLAQGMTITLLNLAPFKGEGTWSAPKQTVLETINGSIATYCAAHPTTVTCIDLYTPMGGQGGDAATLLTAYDSGDLLHWNATGNLYVATQVAAVLP